MALMAVRPGAPLACVAGRVLAHSLNAGNTPQSEFNGPRLSAISGLAGWWDAGVPDGARDANGNVVGSWNAVAASLADLSGNGTPLSSFHGGTDTSPNPMLAVPRVNGFLGAVGSPDNMIAQYGPTLDPDWGLSHPGFDLGSGKAWTLYLVWTRPNWRQGTIQVDDAPTPILHMMATGATIVRAAGPAGGGLVLFPGMPQSTSIAAALDRRHSHALILRNTPGIGVDAWLDGVQTVTAASNPLPASAMGSILLFHDNTVQGSAQCWFHEAGCWTHALSVSEIATLIACQARWRLGARRGINLLVMGQSNAEWFVQSGGPLALAQGVAWYLGAAAWAVTALQSGVANDPVRYSMAAGHPISNSSPPLFPPGAGDGTFLTNPGDGSSPATWAFGPDGEALTAYLSGPAPLVSTADESDIAFLLWPWSEQDSTMPYANKDLYEGSVSRLATLTRQIFGRSAAEMPLLMWSAIPYETDIGVQMVRESVFDLAGDSTSNVVIFATQTADSNPLNSIWNPDTGNFSGGDPLHRDQPDLLRYGRLGVHAAARAALALGLSDAIPAIAVPATGLPVSGGPKIVHVYLANSTEVILTIEHDAGSDLVVPLQAAKGAGFTVMDGGSVADPGPMIPAIAAARIDATHIAVTLARAPTNKADQCFLYYPFGSAQIGRGNAVTDNLASKAPPPGWSIADDLGSAFAIDMPLQATAYGVPLSDTPV